MQGQETHIARNLREVKDRIAEAALRAGRNPDDVCLVAVTKTFPAAAVVTAWEAGQRHFGENRPEEGAEKIPEVMRRLAVVSPAIADATAAQGTDVVCLDAGIAGGAEPVSPVWHMIGHVQSRKAATVARFFDVVHSVDRMKIACRLGRLAQDPAREARPEIPVFIECNVSGEAAKYGYAVEGWEHNAAVRQAFYSEVASLVECPGLRIEGLMTVAPMVEDPEVVRPVFASLRGLREWLGAQFPDVAWRHLSMGMTDDFEVAVEEGATLVRIGRAIFGRRT